MDAVLPLARGQLLDGIPGACCPNDDIESAARLLCGIETRATGRPSFPWPVTDAGYRAMERALANALVKTWQGQADEALGGFVKELERWVPDGAELTDQIIANDVLPYFEQSMGAEFARIATPAIDQSAAESVRFGQLQAARDLGIPRIGALTRMPDKYAIAWLKKDTKHWCRNAMDAPIYRMTGADGNPVMESLGQRISRVCRVTGIEKGLGRIEQGRQLRMELGPLIRGHDYYFEVVASAATSRGRHGGFIAQCEEEGAEELVWHTMGDELVCFTCGKLHGTVMSVSASRRNLDALMGASTPEEAKDATPWIAVDRKRKWRDASGAEQTGSAYYVKAGQRHYIEGNLSNGAWLQERGLTDSGQAHGGCRCRRIVRRR